MQQRTIRPGANSRMIKQSIIEVACLGSTYAIFQFLVSFINGQSSNNCPGIFGNKSEQANHASDSAKSLFFPPERNLSEPAKRRLREQYEDIQNWTLCRKNLAILFLGNYYAAIVLTSITGAIAAAMLFYIVKVSISVAWQKNPWAVTLFVTSTALSAFYASFPLLFRQQENLNSNQSDFLALKNLSNATRSYLATGRIEDGSVIDGDAFILRLDKQIKEATNLSISLDPSKKAVFSFGESR